MNKDEKWFYVSEEATDTAPPRVETQDIVTVKANPISHDEWEPPAIDAKALKERLISRDTIRISVQDSLFSQGYPIDSLRFAPYTNGFQFELGAGKLETGSKVAVRVFEAKVPYDVLLAGLDRQLVINYKETREKITGYPGLKVGSLEEATNNAGNWE